MSEKVFIRKTFAQGRSVVVTIPQKIRDELDIEKGDEIKIELDGNTIKMEKYFE